MLFNSFGFFLFFIVITSVYFAIPHRFRWFLLLCASYYFYMCWKVEYVILIFVSTFISYICALLTGQTDSRWYRKFLLIVSVCTNLGILFAFKYFNFVSNSIRSILASFSVSADLPVLHLLLPVGISFYTFRVISYAVDVYNGKAKPERHFGIFALYVSFFPQLLAGPIERSVNLIPQLYTEKRLDVERICMGVQLIFWGLFKKAVIADRLALYVNSVYDNVEQHSGLSYIIATYFFTFQIYCDFSGYSDMAIGTGQVLGFDLMENFRRPYFATTVTEFWHRWHISLSTWLRDYIYIPLGGNRKGDNRMHANLLATMFLGGLWHGANWTFVIWGLFHGIMLIFSKLTLPLRNRFLKRLGIAAWLIKGFRILITFHLICLSWVFFRANTVGDAFYIITQLFRNWPNVFVNTLSMFYGLLGILILLFVQLLQTRETVRLMIQRFPLAVRWSIYGLTLFTFVLLAVDGESQFIYFQF